MPRLTFVAFDGTRRVLQVAAGVSLMRAAVDNNVPGIDADCGGMCACATCHVFVDPEWAGPAGPRNASEQEMLNFAADLRDNSRLACQITVTAALDGMVVRMPEAQH